MFAERVLVRNSLRQAHIRQDGQLDFGDIEPTAVLGGVVELNLSRDGARLLGRKRRVERRCLMRIY